VEPFEVVFYVADDGLEDWWSLTARVMLFGMKGGREVPNEGDAVNGIADSLRWQVGFVTFISLVSWLEVSALPVSSSSAF